MKYLDIINGVFTDPTDGSKHTCEIHLRDFLYHKTLSSRGAYYTLSTSCGIDSTYITNDLLGIKTFEDIVSIAKRNNLHPENIKADFPYFTDPVEAWELCEILDGMLQKKYGGTLDGTTSKPHRLAGHVKLEFE